MGGAGAVETVVAGIDEEEEMVAGGAGEFGDVEDGVIGLREAVQEKHADDGAQGCEEDGCFESDRDEGGPTVERAAADIERVGNDCAIILERETENGAD